MPSVPDFDFVKHLKEMMAAALHATATLLSVGSVAAVADKVETVYIPADGQEKGLCLLGRAADAQGVQGARERSRAYRACPCTCR